MARLKRTLWPGLNVLSGPPLNSVTETNHGARVILFFLLRYENLNLIFCYYGTRLTSAHNRRIFTYIGKIARIWNRARGHLVPETAPESLWKMLPSSRRIFGAASRKPWAHPERPPGTGLRKRKIFLLRCRPRKSLLRHRKSLLRHRKRRCRP